MANGQHEDYEHEGYEREGSEDDAGYIVPESRGFFVFPVGVYPAVFIDVKKAESSKFTPDKLRLQLVLGIANPGDNSRIEEVFDWVNLASGPKAKLHHVALAVIGRALLKGENVRTMLLRRRCRVVLDVDKTADGRERNYVKSYLPPEGPDQSSDTHPVQ